MFSTLETTWEKSARRGWSTLASFTFQGLALSLLLATQLLWVEGPPRFRLSEVLPPPPPATAPVETERQAHRQSSTNISQGHLPEPPAIPTGIANLHEELVPPAPDLIGVPEGPGPRGPGVPNSILEPLNSAPPPLRPAQTRPIQISHMAPGDLIYRVQPQYPEIARQARIQGTVALRAIISKAGTIENLTVEAGHPMLVPSAIRAVRQWRYRPYVLNGEPVEVGTEITVNFILGG